MHRKIIRKNTKKLIKMNQRFCDKLDICVVLYLHTLTAKWHKVVYTANKKIFFQVTYTLKNIFKMLDFIKIPPRLDLWDLSTLWKLLLVARTLGYQSGGPISILTASWLYFHTNWTQWEDVDEILYAQIHKKTCRYVFLE